MKFEIGDVFIIDAPPKERIVEDNNSEYLVACGRTAIDISKEAIGKKVLFVGVPNKASGDNPPAGSLIVFFLDWDNVNYHRYMVPVYMLKQTEERILDISKYPAKAATFLLNHVIRYKHASVLEARLKPQHRPSSNHTIEEDLSTIYRNIHRVSDMYGAPLELIVKTMMELSAGVPAAGPPSQTRQSCRRCGYFFRGGRDFISVVFVPETEAILVECANCGSKLRLGITNDPDSLINGTNIFTLNRIYEEEKESPSPTPTPIPNPPWLNNNGPTNVEVEEMVAQLQAHTQAAQQPQSVIPPVAVTPVDFTDDDFPPLNSPTETDEDAPF